MLLVHSGYNGLDTPVMQLYGDGIALFQSRGGIDRPAAGIAQQSIAPAQGTGGVLARKGRVKTLQPQFPAAGQQQSSR